MPTLLVTGFGPFPTMPRNPSAALARRVAASPRWRILGIEARSRILTTAYGAIGTELDPALREGPDALLMIGVAGRSRRIRFETRATSRRSLLFPDIAGTTPGKPALASREAFRRTAFAAQIGLRTIRSRGVPTCLSRDAGRYLCNASYFHALGHKPGAVFIHIPKPRGTRPVGVDALKRRERPDDRLAAALVDLGIRLLAAERATRSRKRS